MEADIADMRILQWYGGLRVSSRVAGRKRTDDCHFLISCDLHHKMGNPTFGKLLDRLRNSGSMEERKGTLNR